MTGGKKGRPVMGKLLTSGQRWSGGSVEAGSSPRSPLELKIVSPRGVVLTKGDGGVGLGIVAALGDELFREDEDDEEYTIVTRHMPNNNSYRKVYDGNGKTCVLDISPPADGHFLSSCCDECSKELEGRDVYMYRGERAFCSIECRALGMWKEERTKNKCSSPSPSTTTGIFAI